MPGLLRSGAQVLVSAPGHRWFSIACWKIRCGSAATKASHAARDGC